MSGPLGAPLTLAGGEPAQLIIDLLVILAAAAVVAAAVRRARLQTITGFVVAGAIVGPHALGLVREPESVDQISSLATVLLMFGIGLQLDMSAILRGLVSIVAIGAFSTLAVILVLWLGAMLLGVKGPPALAVAMALGISSTAVAIRVLLDRRELNQQHGRVVVGISIVQDLICVAILSLMPLLALWSAHAAGVSGAGEDGSTGGSAVRALAGLAGTAILIFGGRVVLPRVMHAVALLGGMGARSHQGGGSSELILVTSTAIAVGAAIMTGILGLSPELGAFVAGFLLGGTPYRHQLLGQFAPLRDLLMAVFFTSVGLKVDPGASLAQWWQIGLGAIGLIATKYAVIGATGWLLGASPRVATLSAAYVAHSGEFSFIILAAAAAQAIILPAGHGNAIAVVVLTLVISPTLVGPAHRLASRLSFLRQAPWIRGPGLREAPPGSEDDVSGSRVIVAGFGPVGRHMVDRFRDMGMRVTVIDLNPRTIETQTALGRDVVYGDITSPDVLESAGIESADAFIVTIPDEDAMIRACAVARSLRPAMFIASRANYLSRALLARQAGADEVTVEEIATAEVMERQVIEALRRRAAEAKPAADANA